MTIEIDHDYPDTILTDYKKIIENVVLAALDHETCPYQAQVYVRLTGDEEIHEINRQFRGIDRPTDVLSFPAWEYDSPGDFSSLEDFADAFDPGSGELLLGDIIISMDKVVTQAEEYGHSTTRELAFLTAHSMLHLMGYDHMTKEEAEEMERRQEEILAACRYVRPGEPAGYDIIIIGAGPAGMTAALTCGTKRRVALLESQEVPGRKILVTGNGRCNLTNTCQDISCYRSEDPETVKKVLGERPAEDLIRFMKEIGVYTRNKMGYIYPWNEQAKTVREAFDRAVRQTEGISLFTSCPVRSLDREGDGYRAVTDRGCFEAPVVIIAAGGLAGGEKFGCDGSGYRFAGSLGEKLIPPLPSLTALKSGAPFLKKLAGVRCQAGITLSCDGRVIIRETGQLQWTDYGISGIAVFNVSRYAINALEAGESVRVSIDFFPELKEEEKDQVFYEMAGKMQEETMEAFLLGFVHEKLVRVLLHEVKIPLSQKLKDCTKTQLEDLRGVLAAFELKINGYMGYDKAQVTRGGLSLSGLDQTLGSKINPGLFFAGEIVDVDGSCGGYNLQWAYSSGLTAGRAALSCRSEGEK